MNLKIEDDKELLALYSVKQKENVNDVVINPDLSSEQHDEVRSLSIEYKEIFSDVPKVTNLIEHTRLSLAYSMRTSEMQGSSHSS